MSRTLNRIHRPETKPCEHCGEEYPRPYPLSENRWTKRRFCSHLCAKLGARSRFDAPVKPVPLPPSEGHDPLLARLLAYFARHDALPETLPYARFRELADQCGVAVR